MCSIQCHCRYFDVTASFYNHGCCSFTVLLVLFDLIFHSGRNAKIGLTMVKLGVCLFQFHYDSNAVKH